MLDRPRTFRFGDLVLDCAQRRLLRANQDIYLPPKTFELLVYLIENRGRVIPKGELLDNVWPNVNVVENTLAQRIREIREALGDADNGIALIKTIPRVGYQFNAQLDDGVRGEATPKPVSAARRVRIPGRYVVLFGVLVMVAAVLGGALWPEGRTGSPFGSPPGLGLPAVGEVPEPLARRQHHGLCRRCEWSTAGVGEERDRRSGDAGDVRGRHGCRMDALVAER